MYVCVCGGGGGACVRAFDSLTSSLHALLQFWNLTQHLFSTIIAFLKFTVSNASKDHGRPLDKSAYCKIIFSYFSTKAYVVGAQKTVFNKTVLLSTPTLKIPLSGPLT